MATTVEVKSLGTEAAQEIGTFSFRTMGSQPQEITGKYVVIWEKVVSDWKLATDIWNSIK
jgi:ketosteroid isomerase-like protein